MKPVLGRFSPASFPVAIPSGQILSLCYTPDCDQVIAEMRGLIAASRAQNQEPTGIVLGGRHWHDYCAAVARRSGNLLIPDVFDGLPVYATYPLAMLILLDSAECLHWTLARIPKKKRSAIA